jgi:hypothetical protein
MVEELLRLSRSRRLFAPLAYTVGAFAVWLQGLRRLLANWRLILVEVLPAVWLWLAMYDLRLRLFRGRSFHSAHEAELVEIAALVVVVTVVALFLNVAFALAVVRQGTPSIWAALHAARRRSVSILTVGSLVGLILALSVTVGVRFSRPWSTIALGAAVGLLMIVYLSLPARLLRVDTRRSRRDRLAASALGGLLSAVVSAPFYFLSRLGVLMLGSSLLLVPGYALLTLGVLLQANGVGAVRAIRMSGLLVAGGEHG